MTGPLSVDTQVSPSLPTPGGFFRTPARRPSIVRKASDHTTLPSPQVRLPGAVLEPPSKRRKLDPAENNEKAVLLDGQHAINAAESVEHATGHEGPQKFSFSRCISALKYPKSPSEAGKEQDGERRTNSLLPGLPFRLPSSDPKLHNRKDEKLRSHTVLRGNVAVPTKPYTMDDPLVAPKHKDSHLADFYPWLGNHPEDVLNEQAAKQGYFDRSIVSNEIGSAKQSLYNNFKHRAGLDCLSALFTSAMEQRNRCGQLGSGSAFKPPPRVTLTEARRKAWLSDLADASVPLRKLIRTIPQGIRGQLLLEQCLANVVPIDRAIWFAKSVGANEIRALKRKGTSSTIANNTEHKWLKEWTSAAQHFLEKLLRNEEDLDWRKKLKYGLRLVTSLYSGQLLDRDQYLDWVVKHTGDSSAEHLPLWLMIVQMHGRDLTKHRKRGKHLIVRLLTKLSYLQEQASPGTAPLVVRLSALLKKLAMQRPQCFTIPEKWPIFEPVLKTCFDLSISDESFLFQAICNSSTKLRLQVSNSTPCTATTRRALLDVLDQAKFPFDISAISEHCLSHSQDTAQLVSASVSWATTKYRRGAWRGSLVTQLLCLWHSQGRSLDDTIIEQISEIDPAHADTLSLSELVNNLVQYRAFSLSRYMQWLRSCGLVHKDCFQQSVGDQNRLATATGEFLNIPTCDQEPLKLLLAIYPGPLSCDTAVLRRTILSKAGFPVDLEEHVLSKCRSIVETRLDLDTNVLAHHDRNILTSTPLAIRTSLARWLKESIMSKNAENDDETTISLDYDHFNAVREILETMQQTLVLADVINKFVESQNPHVLASIADTIERHHMAFSALGLLPRTCRLLAKQYLVQKLQNLPSTDFVLALQRLQSCNAFHEISAATLRQDLMRGDRSSSAAAFSPFSDGIAESLQQAGTNFLDDFDTTILAETTMDESKMTQLFGILADRLEKTCFGNLDDNDAEEICMMMNRLRLFKPAKFDMLFKQWLATILVASEADSINKMLGLIISIGPLDFDVLHELLYESTVKKSNFVHPEVALCRMLQDKDNREHKIEDEYRIQTAFSSFCVTAPEKASKMLAGTVSNSILHQSSLTADCVQDDLAVVIIELARKHPNMVETVDIEHAKFLSTGLDRLFLSAVYASSSDFDVTSLFEISDSFSLPLCQLKIRLSARINADLSGSFSEKLAIALFKMAEAEESETSDGRWINIADSLGSDITQNFRDRAEDAFFHLPLPKTDPNPNLLQQASCYHRIIVRTADTIPPHGVPRLNGQYIEKLNQIIRCLSLNPNGSVQQNTAIIIPPEHLSTVVAYTSQLLDVLTLHCSSFAPLPTSTTPVAGATPHKQVQQDQIKIVVLLMSLATHPSLVGPTNSALVRKIFEVTSLLVDDLAEDSRALVVRFLKDKMKDPRLDFLLGSLNDASIVNDLFLVKEGKGVVGEFRAKQWEMLEGGQDPSLSLSLFQARTVRDVKE